MRFSSGGDFCFWSAAIDRSFGLTESAAIRLVFFEKIESGDESPHSKNAISPSSSRTQVYMTLLIEWISHRGETN